MAREVCWVIVLAVLEPLVVAIVICWVMAVLGRVGVRVIVLVWYWLVVRLGCSVGLVSNVVIGSLLLV